MKYQLVCVSYLLRALLLLLVLHDVSGARAIRAEGTWSALAEVFTDCTHNLLFLAYLSSGFSGITQAMIMPSMAQ